jgi:hypothetical protein
VTLTVPAPAIIYSSNYLVGIANLGSVLTIEHGVKFVIMIVSMADFRVKLFQSDTDTVADRIRILRYIQSTVTPPLRYATLAVQQTLADEILAAAPELGQFFLSAWQNTKFKSLHQEAKEYVEVMDSCHLTAYWEYQLPFIAYLINLGIYMDGPPVERSSWLTHEQILRVRSYNQDINLIQIIFIDITTEDFIIKLTELTNIQRHTSLFRLVPDYRCALWTSRQRRIYAILYGVNVYRPLHLYSDFCIDIDINNIVFISADDIVPEYNPTLERST